MYTTFFNKAKFIWGILLLIPVLLYYYLLVHYSINLPIMDDFNTIIRFILDFLAAGTTSSRLSLLMVQSNEHHIVFEKLVFLVQYYLTGAINFRILMFIGNAAVLFTAILLFRNFDGGPYKALLFLPVVLVIFQLQSCYIIFFALGSMQNLYILFFTLLYLRLISIENRKNFIAALIIYAVAVFTSGYGIFLVVIGAGILVWQKRYRLIPIHILVTAILAIIYFYSYHKPEVNPAIVKLYGIETDTPAKDAILRYPFLTLKFFLQNLGASAQIWKFERPLTLLLGIFFLLYTGYLTFIGYYKKNIFIYASMICVLMIGSIISINRCTLWYNDVYLGAVDGKYRMYSNLFLALSIISFLELTNKRKQFVYLFPIILTFGIVFNYLSTKAVLPSLRQSNAKREAAFNDWRAGGKWKLTTVSSDESIVREAIDKGVWKPMK